jgi:hypothetical protein
MALLPALGLGASVAGSIINPILQHNQNIRNRKNAIADRDFENNYNSPKEQMKRLKDAGLNPHLAYGSGAGASVSVGTKSPAGQAPEANGQPIASSLMAFQDFAIKTVERDRLREQIELLKLQQDLTKENTLNRWQDTENKALKYSFDSGLFQTNTDMQKERLRGQQIGNLKNLTQTETMQIMQQPNLEKTLEEILSIKERRSMIPYQKDLIRQQMANLETSRILTESKTLSEAQQREVKRGVMELMQEQVKSQQTGREYIQSNIDLNRIKQKFKSMGLSETATSDLLNNFLDIKAKGTIW